MNRSDTGPINEKDIWSFNLAGFFTLKTPWPTECDDWRDKQFEGQIIEPIIPCPLEKIKGNCLMAIERDAWDSENNPTRRECARCFQRHNKCWVVRVHVHPRDCPREIIDSVKGAFERAGYGKRYK